MNFLFALFAAIVVNGDFESGKGTDVPGWPLSKEGKKAWSVRPGAGLNGNRGFVWENADPGLYTFPKQEVKLEAGKRYRVEAHVSGGRNSIKRIEPISLSRDTRMGGMAK